MQRTPSAHCRSKERSELGVSNLLHVEICRDSYVGQEAEKFLQHMKGPSAALAVPVKQEVPSPMRNKKVPV